MGPRLVLAGGGHAHLFVLEALARGRFPAGVAATLIAPDPLHAYSGMVPGLVEGRYRPDEIVIDLAGLARRAGAEFVRGKVGEIIPEARSVALEDGRRVNYDLLSLAVGSMTAAADRPGVARSAVLVKPIERTLEIVPELERAVRRTGAEGPRIAVAGGGAGGVELAFNLRARLRLLGRPDAPITVIESGDRILRERSGACRQLAERALRRSRIATRLGSGVAALEGTRLTFEDGRTTEVDVLVWATGAMAPGLIARSGLAVDAEGYLLVDATLRSISHSEVFGAGDTASLADARVPKAGVYSVREGPVLSSNLAAAAAARTVRRRYRPQRRFLVLLGTGDGSAICCYGALAARGRWAMKLKERIDRRFMRRFAR